MDKHSNGHGEETESRDIKSRVGEAVSHRVEAVRDGAERASSAVADNPLALVGGAFALGLLAGLVLPVTEAEHRRIGPLRDQLLDRAHDVANEAVEHGKQVVRESARAAMETAVTSAQEHGQEVLESAQRATGSDQGYAH
jgi:ElaB/YqjD/DUF883 family membrane-anchored ribosome-binding protein